MYSIDGHGQMIADVDRMTAYTDAMARLITPESVVLDIGTGTGVMACIACRLGARHVVAVEPGPVIHVARRIAAANGFADRIHFIQAPSTEITLDQPADLIVSDLRGVLPPLGRNIPAIADARDRLMAPDGKLVPGVDTLHLALVSAPDIYGVLTEPWDNPDHGLNMVEARNHVTNMWYRRQMPPGALVTPPAPAAILDYTRITAPDIHARVDWMLDRSVLCHGLVAWFDTELIPGIGFSNAPDAPAKIYAQGFFPFSAPLAIDRGSRVTVDWMADLVGDDYHWRWKAQAVRPDGRSELRDQSTFHGMMLNPDELKTLSADHCPRLNPKGRIAQWLLAKMDGTRTLTDLSQLAATTFPERFESENEAMVMVRTISQFASRLPGAV